MIFMNESMKNQFDCEKSVTGDLARKIVSGIRIINDCLVYDEKGEIDLTRINFERIMDIHGDRTGYEIACNEIRFDKDILCMNQVPFFLFELDREITDKFAKKVVIYIQKFEESIELRFHTYREGEKRWLSENLDEYDVPIICYCS